jgi:glycerol-3-phosphate dehydrogenase
LHVGKYGRASKIDYDIAIIGAGAYGFPLATRFKHQGKQAIHIGGAIQILFGIKRHRWNNIPRVAKHYNEHWIYPLEKKPEKADAAGVGTYW